VIVAERVPFETTDNARSICFIERPVSGTITGAGVLGEPSVGLNAWRARTRYDRGKTMADGRPWPPLPARSWTHSPAQGTS